MYARLSGHRDQHAPANEPCKQQNFLPFLVNFQRCEPKHSSSKAPECKLFSINKLLKVCILNISIVSLRESFDSPETRSKAMKRIVKSRNQERKVLIPVLASPGGETRGLQAEQSPVPPAVGSEKVCRGVPVHLHAMYMIR